MHAGKAMAQFQKGGPLMIQHAHHQVPTYTAGPLQIPSRFSYEKEISLPRYRTR